MMGVAGSGKTTVGRRLAADLGWPFVDGDDLHPAANVEKMRRGVPLDDADRRPWLARVREVVERWLAAGTSGVVACSALRESYRRRLRIDDRVKVVYLRGERAVLRERLERREGHFMPAALLDSQLATLEEPDDAIVADVTAGVDAIVASIRAALGRSSGG